MYTDIILIDLQKPFDTINHKALIRSAGMNPIKQSVTLL